MTIEGFIHASGHATSTQELFEAYKKAMAALGFDRIIFSLMTDHPVLQLPAGHGIMCNYPDEWMAFYTRQNYELIDPVRHRVFTADSAFPWDSVLEGYPLTKKQVACLTKARDAGLHNGIGIPLRGPRGVLAGIGAASSEHNDKRVHIELLSLAFLLSQQFYAQFRRLEKKLRQQAFVWLSAQERAVLEWCAKGKTRDEIGDILCISPSTVKFHIQKVQLKLEAANKTSAAIKAAQQGLIRVA